MNWRPNSWPCTTAEATTCGSIRWVAECIVLGGQPLGEPVVSYGPFVMNDRSQIQRCIADYRAGRMGTLVRDSPSSGCSQEDDGLARGFD